MISKKDGVERLAYVPLFSGLSARERGRVWSTMMVVDYAAGDQIIKEGQQGVGFHLILSGSVRVERQAGGRAVKLGPNQSFGEMALIDDGPRSASVTAIEPTVTASLLPSSFRSLVRKHPDMMWKLLTELVQRLRDEQSVTASMTS